MSKQLLKSTNNKLNKLLENTGDMALKRRARRIVEEINPKDGDSILDVGCGDGFYLHIFSSLGFKLKLTGIDYDNKALNSAKKNLKGKRICLIQADLMKKLPFKAGVFDKVVMSEVVEHLPNDEKGLKEISRVMKTGGVLCLTVPNANYPFLWDPVNWFLEHFIGTHIRSGFWAGIWNQHERLYTPKEISSVLKKSGYSVVKCESVTGFCIPFNHNLLNLAARKLYGGSVSDKTTQAISKFKTSTKRPTLIDYSYKILNWVDKLNDLCSRKESGVGIFVKSVKI
jgi:ubiquinone/menaquinone biosynthesis C-methylase UbiE